MYSDYSTSHESNLHMELDIPERRVSGNNEQKFALEACRSHISINATLQGLLHIWSKVPSGHAPTTWTMPTAHGYDNYLSLRIEYRLSPAI